jgi:hypothetical protein
MTLVGQSHLRNPQAAGNGFMLFREIVSLKFFWKKLPVFYSRSNESGLAPPWPQFKWLDNIFKKAEHMSCMVQYIYCIQKVYNSTYLYFLGGKNKYC